MPKKNGSAPIYFKSLEIENIRCFGSKQVLNLLKPNGTLPQWTLLLGDNGIGKTTLLQCLAWMTPKGRYSKAGRPLGVMPALLEEENVILLDLIRSSEGKKKITTRLRAKFCLNKLNEKVGSSKTDKRTGIDIISKDEKLQDAIPKDNSSRIDSEVNIIAYSASRKIGRLNLNREDFPDMFLSFFDEDTELFDPEEILTTLDYSSSKNDKVSNRLLKKIKNMLVDILPDLQSMNDIIILGPQVMKEFTTDSEIGGVVFSTPFGIIPLDGLSLGYRINLAWTVDLAWRLFRIFPKSNDPLNEPAIVLIDEIDLHLHPLWQRTIMRHLSKHFPRVQFIATAHSPFMIQATYDANHAVLKKIGDEVIINNTPEAVDGWRIDQIATSELIGVPTARGENYEKIYDERKKLLEKSRLNKEEKERLKKLDKKMAELPTGETPEEIEARWFVQRAAEELRKSRKIKIDKDK